MRYSISFDIRVDDEDFGSAERRIMKPIIRDMIMETFNDHGAIFRRSPDGDGWIDRDSKVIKSTISIKEK